MNIALVIIFIFLAFAVCLGIRARRGKDMHLEEWTVGGRGFGAIFIFLLLAGEIYTTFTFLGGSGWAYGEGGAGVLHPRLRVPGLRHVLLAAPRRLALRQGQPPALSQADFFASKYESSALGVLVSLVAVVAMVPYLALQFKGLGLIVSEASYGAISATVAAIIGTRRRNRLRDHQRHPRLCLDGRDQRHHGARGRRVHGHLPAVRALRRVGRDVQAGHRRQKPGFLILPEGTTAPRGSSRRCCSPALGFYMWPHTFGATFTAENERVFRRNATFLPLYQLHPPLRLLRRLRGRPEGARPLGREGRPLAAGDLQGYVQRARRRARSAPPAC